MKPLYLDEGEQVTGSHLRAIRERQHRNIGQFANVTGYSWSQVQRMEKGKQPVSKRMVFILEAYEWLKRRKSPRKGASYVAEN